jgi:toxin HigB-1
MIVPRYYGLMIKTFACPETEKISRGQRSHKLPSDIQSVARRKLSYLKNAKTLQDLRIPPANRLEALQGDRRGQYSIRINEQWRICFAWHNGDAYGVEIVDYH